MGKFCIKCGVEEPELIIDGFCVNCLVNEGKAVKPPKSVEATVCPLCGSVKVGKRWLQDIDLKDHIRELILSGSEFHREFKITSLNITLEGDRVVASFSGVLKHSAVAKDYLINFIANRSLCPQCSRIKGGYYEAVIQIRTYTTIFRRSLIDRIVNSLLKSPNISNNISEIEFIREGLDVKVLSLSVARKLVNDLVSMYGGTSVETWKVVGKSPSGKKVSKLTISLRISGLSPGDFIMLKERLALVEGVSGDNARIKFLDSDEVVRLNFKDVNWEDLSLLIPEEYEVVDAYVINVSNNKVLVKEVGRGNTHEVFTRGAVKVGSRVKLLIYRDRIYLAGIEK
ncbi:MAG: NMD3-related protein [Sulfolobales archaeon]